MEDIPSFLTTSSSNAVHQVRSINHIPNDITFFILSKLPIKSLKLFECVNKSWSFLFDNPNFMTMFINYLLTKPCSYYDDDTSLLLHLRVADDPQEVHEIHNYLYSLFGERFENRVKLDWPNALTEDVYRLQKEQCELQGWGVPHLQPDVQLGDDDQDDDGPFQEYDYGFEISHSVSFNGILCLESEFYGQRRVVLWNPTTNEFKLIPLPENNPWYILADHYQIGYDHVKDDYKMIRCTCYSPKMNPYNRVPSEHFWEMYSLSSNSWKKINVSMPPSCWMECLVGGMTPKQIRTWCRLTSARNLLLQHSYPLM